MKVIDISWPITKDITEYKNKGSLKIEQAREFDKHGVREKLFTINSHTGTHVDAPAHFLKDGKTLDDLSLEKLVGKCQVLDLTNVKEKITQQDLEKFDIKEGEIIIFKTQNSFLPEAGDFVSEFVYLDKSGAQYLANKNIKAVGIDYLGIERNQPGHPTHKTLLEKDILIIEGLRLKKVEAKSYEFYCLPLFFTDADGALARAVLIER